MASKEAKKLARRLPKPSRKELIALLDQKYDWNHKSPIWKEREAENEIKEKVKEELGINKLVKELQALIGDQNVRVDDGWEPQHLQYSFWAEINRRMQPIRSRNAEIRQVYEGLKFRLQYDNLTVEEALELIAGFEKEYLKN